MTQHPKTEHRRLPTHGKIAAAHDDSERIRLFMNSSARMSAQQQRYKDVRKVTLIGSALDLYWVPQKLRWEGWSILRR